MNICNQYVVGLLVCSGLVALPAYADEAPDSTTGATLKSKISMMVVKPSCGSHIEAVTKVNFTAVSPKEIKDGSNKKDFFFKIKCSSDQGHFYVNLTSKVNAGSSAEDGYIATNRSDVAIHLTWNSTNFETPVQMGSPVKLNYDYYFDKVNVGLNELRFTAQLVSWPLNTLIAFDPSQGKEEITAHASILVTYI